MTLRKLILTIFFTFVTINLILEKVALLATQLGEIQSDILLTSLSISAASVLSLAMFSTRELRWVQLVTSNGLIYVCEACQTRFRLDILI